MPGNLVTKCKYSLPYKSPDAPSLLGVKVRDYQLLEALKTSIFKTKYRDILLFYVPKCLASSIYVYFLVLYNVQMF